MFKPILLGVALASAALCAQAGVTATKAQLAGTAVTLSVTNVSGGTLFADNVTNGDVSNDMSAWATNGLLGTAAQPWQGSGQSTFGTWLAAGPSTGTPATLSLSGGTSAVGFLWGSADYYNSFSVTTSGTDAGTTTFGTWASAATEYLGIVLNGDQRTANYMTFTADAGSYITSIVFSSKDTNAIEIANVTAVPEPEAYGLALAGLSVVGFAMARRRKS